jgi:hypothetical protein
VIFGDLALERLISYSWPGNIRELENCVKYLTCLQLARPIYPYDLPLLEHNETLEASPAEALLEGGPLKALKRDLVSEFERKYLESALRRSGGNIAAAARASGKPRRAFFELMRKRGVVAQQWLVEAAGETDSADGQHESVAEASSIGRSIIRGEILRSATLPFEILRSAHLLHEPAPAA